MDSYMVSCKDRRGLQHSITFDVDKNQKASILRSGWQEAIQLCGHITAVASASVRTIDGQIVGTLR
jgi:hypothetical protein